MPPRDLDYANTLNGTKWHVERRAGTSGITEVREVENKGTVIIKNKCLWRAYSLRMLGTDRSTDVDTLRGST